MATTANNEDIVAEIATYIRVYRNGTVERPRQAPFVPPSLDDPQTGVSSKDIVISDEPPISARLYLPKCTTQFHHDDHQKLPILVYYHGGGFFFESAFSQLYHRYLNLFVSQVNVVVVSVEYRLAPEHYLPAAYEDCWAALKWVATCSTKDPCDEPWLNYGDFSRVFIAGDSAGGNIVHNIAMRGGVEDLPGGVRILGAIYVHPYFCGSSPIGSEPVSGRDQTVPVLAWKFAYPSAPGGLDNPMVNPLAPGAPSLAGLGCSRILVCVAGKDSSRDRGVWFYEGVKKSGWKGELELFEQEGEDHVYHIFHPESENGKKMTKRMASFITKEETETMATTANNEDIVAEIPTYIRVYRNGTVERPRQAPFVPPSLDDPQTGVSSKDIVISDEPPISARLYLPKSTTQFHHDDHQKLPILVYYHGGGFFFESAFSQLYHRYLNLFVSQVNVVVVSVEYRLAPENYLPAAYEDCWAALKWVATCSTRDPCDEPWLNYGDFSRVFIAGDSAGGNIVHNIAMRGGVEDLPGGVRILGAIYVHPYFCGSSPIGSEPVSGRDQTVPVLAWKFAYPSAPGGLDNPMVNPLAPGAPSLAGLGCSRILVCVAGKDSLRDRGVWFYEGVKKSGWKGELELFEQEGEDHVYHIFDPESDHGKKMTKRMASFIMKEETELD
ncbi:uncharacterized protein LOC114719745 [Neltuma alba]|uniref:uncharacterized protein LOC114719745 n=1 Tax=Neltuma alba TaxID=207710 RepID=UPI0010A5634A|nr:uncharacterized protein LOC114719745 [Prosopis alba]